MFARIGCIGRRVEYAAPSMKLPRVQAFEFNETPSVPAFVRDTVVESLSRTLKWGHILGGLVQPFQRFLRESGSTEVLDLCAGAAGPAVILASEMQRRGVVPPRFLMTDLFPQIDAWVAARGEHPDVIDFVGEPVDATRIPAALADGRARVIINALHHFPKELARGILGDAVRGSRGIFVSEAFERTPLGFFSMIPAGLPALLANPFLTKKHRLAKAAMTYLTPLTMGISLWDGVVSSLRIYSKEDLFEMVAPFGDAFRWEYGLYHFRPFGRGMYFYGVPKG